MGCGCKEHSRGVTSTPATIFEAVEKTRPMDQCIACTQKHIADAFAAYSEYTYTATNRAHIMGQLQLAIHHSDHRWRNIADMARELSHLIQRGDDRAIGPRWADIIEAAAEAYGKEHPEAAQKLKELEECRGRQ